AVLDEGTPDNGLRAAVDDDGPAPDDRDEGGGAREEREDDLDAAASALRHERLDEDAEDTGPQDEKDGRQCRPVDDRCDEGVHFPLPSASTVVDTDPSPGAPPGSCAALTE